MKIAIIDDHLHCLNTIHALITSVFDELKIHISECATFEYASTFFKDFFRKGYYDLIILDITMQEGDFNGIQLAEKIRLLDRGVQLVFCTSSNNHAQASYDVHASYYIEKPITKKSVEKMMHHLTFPVNTMEETISFDENTKFHVYKLLCSEYHDHYVTFYLKDGIELRKRLLQQEVEKKFSPFKTLFECNRGTFVNFAHIDFMDDTKIILKNGKFLSITKNKSKEIHEAYARYQNA